MNAETYAKAYEYISSQCKRLETAPDWHTWAYYKRTSTKPLINGGSSMYENAKDAKDIILNICKIRMVFQSHYPIYRAPKQVIHNQKSSLNHIKTTSAATFLINFEYKMRKWMLQVCIKYSMCDLICDVISCCVWSFDMVKINVHDKIVIYIQKKR